MQETEEITTEAKPEPRFASIRRLPRLMRESWREDLVAFRNWWRKRRARTFDYVVLHVSGAMPERDPPRRSFLQRFLPLPEPALSIETLNVRLQRIGDAPNVQGVVIILRDLSDVGLARSQNIRASLKRLRTSGKEVVVYTPYLDLAHYYIATIADRVVAPPGAQFDVVGLVSQAVFVRDSLQKIGVEAEVLQVSPYKTAANVVSQSAITPEQLRQMTWLIDDMYDVLTADMARDRGMAQEAIKQLIDSAPFTAQQAAERGLIDCTAYEDQLPALLADGHDNLAAGPETDGSNGDEAPRGATLITWQEARSRLLERVRHPVEKFVGVVSIEGAIVMGASRQPPIELPIPIVGGAMAGEETVVQQLRSAAQDETIAAVVVHVESGGGSSLASDLMWREIAQLATCKPVVAYMGNVAGSGGYYVSAGGTHIMSQRSTITGSIGVVLVRMSISELLKKSGVNSSIVKRGQHADLYVDPRPLTLEERAVLWEVVQDSYEQFKAIVQNARGLEAHELEEIAGGRVWTGRQALDKRLVDSHGDFVDAIHLAASMAGLPSGEGIAIPTRNIGRRSAGYLPPKAGEPIASLIEVFSTRQIRSLNGQALAISPLDLQFNM